MNIQIGKQSKAFFRGLSTIIDPKWIRMFNQVRLSMFTSVWFSKFELNEEKL